MWEFIFEKTFMAKKGIFMQESNIIEYKEALRRAAALCSRQEQCSSHIMEKLKHWNISEDDSKRILGLLQKEKYLDDQQVCHFLHPR